MEGHFSVNQLYTTLCCNWYWENMYVDGIILAGTVLSVL